VIRATAVRALPPLLPVHSVLSASLASEARCGDFNPGSLDLRALIHCEVRCARLTFLPARCPMLPWALPFEGLIRSTMQPISACVVDAEAVDGSAPKCAVRASRMRPRAEPKPVSLASQSVHAGRVPRPATFT
jgi:hypothetical protein